MRQFQFTISAEHTDPGGAGDDAPYIDEQLIQFNESDIHDIVMVVHDFAGTYA